MGLGFWITKYGFLLSTKQCNVDWNHWNHKTRFASHGRHEQKPFEEYKKTIFDSNVCTRTTHNILHWSHWNHKICLTRVSWAKVFDHRKKPYSILTHAQVPQNILSWHHWNQKISHTRVSCMSKKKVFEHNKGKNHILL